MRHCSWIQYYSYGSWDISSLNRTTALYRKVLLFCNIYARIDKTISGYLTNIIWPPRLTLNCRKVRHYCADDHWPLTRYVKLLRMRRECRDRFPRHRFKRKSLVSEPGMHHGTCVTYVPWCMSRSLTRGGGVNVPVIPGAQPAILRIWQEAHAKWRVCHSWNK